MSKAHEALRLVQLAIDSADYSHHADMIEAVEILRSAVEDQERMGELLRKASICALIAHDWNVTEVEIDGEMVSTYELHKQFKDAYRTALDAARTQAQEKETRDAH